MGMTISEKILAKSSGKEVVAPGDIVDAFVDVAMSHEACAQVLEPFKKMGAKKIWNLDKVVIAFDHWVPPSSEGSAIMQQKVREFVKGQGIKNFFDVGRHGIAHQILAEEGFVSPGDLVVATDSHTTTLGALGAFATGIGPTEMAAVFAQGKLWLKVPENLKIDIEGYPPKRVVGKDIILKIVSEVGVDGAIYKAIEFTGSTVSSMPMSNRLTLCNMTVEMGAKTGIIPADNITKNYLSGSKKRFSPMASDEDAIYQEERSFHVKTLEPQVACPPNVDNVKPARDLKNVRIDQAFLGSCTNGRIEDLRAAAEILKGEKIHKDVRFIVSPASQKIFRQAMLEGLMEIFLEADAVFCHSSCGPCFGGHMGILAPGEVCISTSNRNFPGRMGSSEALIYLASPYTVAASALYGVITDPREV